MAETVERLVATLEADIRGFTRNMQEAQRQFDRNAAAIERRQNAMMSRINKGFSGVNLGPLISRYFSLAAAIRATQTVVRESIENNDQAAKAWERLDKAMADIGNSSGPIVAGIFDIISATFEELSREIDDTVKDFERLQRLFAGGVNIKMGVSPLQPGYNKEATLDKKTGNYTTAPGGFAVPGVTDVTPGQDKELEAAYAYAEELGALYRGIASDRIETEEETQRKLLEEALAYGEQLGEIYRQIAADRIETEEETQQRLLDDALEYADQLGKELRDISADRIQAQLEAQADRIAEIGDAFEYLGQAAFQGGEAFKHALASMAQSLALSGLRHIFEGFLGSLAGGGGFVGGLISGARAGGGPVSGGQRYLVGENGPEIFEPSTSGVIIPNAVASSGGGSMTIHMPIDARGAQQGVAEQIARVAPAIVAAAVRESGRQFKTNLIKTNRNQM